MLTAIVQWVEGYIDGALCLVRTVDETSGRLKNPDDSDWYKVDLGTNAFGQGVAVSVIQMMSAASALANDGKMVYPHVLKAMINNGVPYNTPNQSLGTPISAQTARTVTGMLADALEARGWSVSGLLLPGFGSELPTLYQRRTEEWICAIQIPSPRRQPIIVP